MMIAVLKPNAQPGDHYDPAYTGELVTHPANAAMKAVKLSDGLWLCVTPSGTLRHDPVEDVNAGPWQAFQVGTNASFLIAGRGNGAFFMVPYVAFDGPATP